ncbi:transposase [Candidatus Peregrinibacteria bacterium]|nr:MAG: transposase [Candidatus Peregrinibacteria bacterium]QQS58742.1 MAG: transposase [Candidatus Peregrinibacteria bacterium]
MATRNKTEFEANNIYFITFTICEWQKILTSQKYFDLFYEWFDHQKEKYQNKIHGYVIMPNHFHGLIYISDKSPPIPKLIQNAKRFMAYKISKYLLEDNKQDILELFSQAARREKGARHKVFEDRYDSKIMSNADLYHQKLNYIHNNPCKPPWNLADTPERYTHSSALNYEKGIGHYDVDVLYE